MPKKRQGKALLIKPGSQVTSVSPSSRQHESTAPSVNDLIRESRKLQLKNEPPASSPLTSSVPPHLRDVLNLPTPQAPAPRAGVRTSGPARQRRIPGPPPPRSWLIDSRHAPPSDLEMDYKRHRLQTTVSVLPGGSFPVDGSLLHSTLKELAVNWEWHAEYDGTSMATLPTTIKQLLLTYIGVYKAYNDEVHTNPLRLLFAGGDEVESRLEVSRLDMTGGIGTWTTVRQLTLDFANREPVWHHAASSTTAETVPASWDDDAAAAPSIVRSLNSCGMAFSNLKHLSLALSPGTAASWKDLIHLASEVSTIISLSLAYWPQPTYTPLAAATRALVKVSGSGPGTVYGGSNFYTALDNDWREAAGIVRTLSRTLYCLKWLDLTGCGDWFGALVWQPEEGSAGPEWNGGWRGIERVCLGVGWKPVPLEFDEGESSEENDGGWNVEIERQRYYHRQEQERYTKITRSAEAVVQHLRALRRNVGGKWLDFDL
jgi:hypothetical protein